MAEQNPNSRHEPLLNEEDSLEKQFESLSLDELLASVKDDLACGETPAASDVQPIAT